LRAHGIANFPDPVLTNGGIGLNLGSGINPGSPQFRAAQQACRSLLPGQALAASTARNAPEERQISRARPGEDQSRRRWNPVLQPFDEIRLTHDLGAPVG
jgi:hypothetical protein